MPQKKIVLIGITIIAGICGLGALTNPNSSAYEAYAEEQLGNVAKSQCDKAPAGFGIVLQGPCRAAIDAFKPQLRPLLSASTSRQNIIVFSIYRSDISIPVVNINAKIESVGIFNNFFTYKTP